MRAHPRAVIIAVVVLLTAGCASTPEPVIYPNEHYQTVGQSAADRDVAACNQLAETAGATHDRDSALAGSAKTTAGSAAIGAASGAVGGAIVGSPGTGAAIGAVSAATAAILRSIFTRGPSRGESAYTAFMTRCLNEKGYDLTGWK